MSLWSFLRRKLGGNTPMRSTSLEYYRNLYSTMEVLKDWKPRVASVAKKPWENKKRYEDACVLINDHHKLNMDWKIIACIHSMEASCNFDKQILCGQPWTQKTTITPKGLGPWKNWEDSCITAFANDRWDGVDFEDIGSILKASEAYNGLGMAKRGKNTPYLWSGSQHGVGVGKYVRDGVYSSTSVSDQVGWALLYKKLSEMEVA